MPGICSESDRFGVALVPDAAAVGLSPLPGICSESDRFGVAVAGSLDGYDVSLLHTGWYHSFTVASFPPRPAGMWYAQTIRLSGANPFADRACSTCPTWETLRGIAQANPGSLWIIGNEPDRQDYVYAERYAQLYYDFYTFLKITDPTCSVRRCGPDHAHPPPVSGPDPDGLPGCLRYSDAHRCLECAPLHPARETVVSRL